MRIRRKHLSWLSIAVGLFLFLASYYGWFNKLNQTAITTEPGQYKVARFIDGDTIAVDMNGKVETIRFIGVDTPETHKPNTPVQCYGPSAAALTKNLIGDSPVKLALDPESTNRDRYDRLLRYVYLPDGTLLNLKIIQLGYGFYYPYFPFTKSQEFKSAQDKARASHFGLWGKCSPMPTEGGGFISNPM